MQLKGVEEVEVWLQIFLMSALDKAERLHLHRRQVYFLEGTTTSIEQKALWAPKPVWTFQKRN
jgi:hypothetical protein